MNSAAHKDVCNHLVSSEHNLVRQGHDMLSTNVKKNQYTEKVTEDFDFSFDGAVSFRLPRLDLSSLPAGFKVGVLVGPSGTGKTSLLRKFGEVHDPSWDGLDSVMQHGAFACLPTSQAHELLTAVGLSDVQGRLPFHCLSDGQKARADTAALLAPLLNAGCASETKFVVIDEFTSLLDRTGAQGLGESIGRYIVAHQEVRGVVLATCHQDVLPALASVKVLD